MGPRKRVRKERVGRTLSARRPRALAIRWLTGLAVMVFASSVMTPVARAAPAPISVQQVRPVTDASSAIVVQRVSGLWAGNPAKWRLNMDFLYTNSSASSISLTKAQVWYPNSGLGTVTKNFNPAVTSTAGQQRLFIVPDNRLFSFPVASVVRVKLFFQGFDPYLVTRNLVEYKNETPTGGYRLPMKTSDLGPFEYWKSGNNQEVTSHHRGNPSQRFAYDLVVERWVAGKWTQLKPFQTGASNDDYYTFGKPMYAMAGGTVLECKRTMAENTVLGPDQPNAAAVSNGNHLYVDHGNGEIALYAHLKNGTVPAELCPTESTAPLNGNDPTPLVHAEPVQVEEGQFIGQVGNTGSSSGPHTHIHIQKEPPTDWRGGGGTSGLPLLFDHAKLRSRAIPATFKSPGFFSLKTPAALATNTEVLPNPCGWVPVIAGGAEWARHGVSESCYQEIVNDTTAQGYRLVWVNGYNVGNSNFFNAIFRPVNGLAWAAFHNKTADGVQSMFNSLTDQGYRLTQIDSYVRKSAIRYAGVFTKDSGPGFAVYLNATPNQHLAKFNQFTEGELRPVNISAVTVDGSRRYTALYAAVDAGSFFTTTTPASDFGALFNAQAEAGRKLVYMDGFREGGVTRISGIWHSTASADYNAGFGLTSAQYQTAYETETGAGRLTDVVSGYFDGNGTRFAAIWRKPPA